MSDKRTKSDQSNHGSNGMAPQCIGTMKIAQNCHERSHARKWKGAHQTPRMMASQLFSSVAAGSGKHYVLFASYSVVCEKYDRFIFVANTRGQR